MRKGQLFSGDIAVATFMFMTALALAFFLWSSVSQDIQRSEDRKDMEWLAADSVEQLIRTPGVPEDWSIFTVRVPGIADDRVINESKAADFVELMNSTNYGSNAHLMGIAPYEFYMNVTDLGGELVRVEGKEFTAGRAPSGASESVYMPRTAICNGTIARINYVVWR